MQRYRPNIQRERRHTGCKNYRGIKFMSHTMKIYERILERRVRGETLVGDEQFGFMPGRSTTDVIFGLRQLLEKYG